MKSKTVARFRATGWLALGTMMIWACGNDGSGGGPSGIQGGPHDRGDGGGIDDGGDIVSHGDGGRPGDDSGPNDSGNGPQKVLWGMWIKTWQQGGGADNSMVTRAESMVAHRNDLVHWFASDDENWEYDGHLVDLVLTELAGRTPMITWEFRKNYTLSDITAGRADAYIDSWAQGMAQKKPNPIYLRIFHEFNDPYNGSDVGYRWGVCGGTNWKASDLVAAYRHVHDRFAAAGATNASFLWCPDGTFDANSMYGGSSCPALSAAYPGDAYVDDIGWDTYGYDNDRLYTVMSQVSKKPMVLAEIGNTDSEGGPAWINALASKIDSGQYSQLRGVVWFDQDKWLLENNANTLAAIKAMVAGKAWQ